MTEVVSDRSGLPGGFTARCPTCGADNDPRRMVTLCVLRRTLAENDLAGLRLTLAEHDIEGLILLIGGPNGAWHLLVTLTFPLLIRRCPPQVVIPERITYGKLRTPCTPHAISSLSFFSFVFYFY